MVTTGKYAHEAEIRHPPQKQLLLKPDEWQSPYIFKQTTTVQTTTLHASLDQGPDTRMYSVIKW